jgi:hypothetical protein
MVPQIRHVSAEVVAVAIAEHSARGVNLSAAAALYARETWPALTGATAQADEKSGDR